MDQDIAIRLANEGVPVRAIARAVRLPSADVRNTLETARNGGYLIDLPAEDWPVGYPREQRLVELARLVSRNKPALEMAVRTVFKVAPVEVPILLVLLRNDEVPRSRMAMCSANSLTANLCRLRRQLARFGLTIETLYGYGYCMPATHRRRALDIILETATEMAKATHEEAHYREGAGTRRCGNCAMFRPGKPPACTAVRGPIRANDVCDYFERKT